jgi:hypothetical protein
MKAILEFNLPDDDHEFLMATTGNNMFNVLCEMDQWLRQNTKYAPDSMSEDTYEAFIKCREHLRQLINENNVEFD